MDIKVDLDGDKINEEITRAIIDSAIGDEIRKQIKAELDNLNRSYNNPYKEAVQNLIRAQVGTLFREEFAALVQAKIREFITEQKIEEIAEKALEGWLCKT